MFLLGFGLWIRCAVKVHHLDRTDRIARECGNKNDCIAATCRQLGI